MLPPNSTNRNQFVAVFDTFKALSLPRKQSIFSIPIPIETMPLWMPNSLYMCTTLTKGGKESKYHWENIVKERKRRR